VVGDAVLREVVGAHPLGAVHGADLAAPFRGGLCFGRGLRFGQQAGPQHPKRLLFVLQLALLVLAGHHDPRGQVDDPHRGVGGVHALPAGARGTVDIDAQIALVDLHLDLFSLGQHQHANGRGVDPSLRLGDGDPLDAVDSAFELEPVPHALPGFHRAAVLDRDGDVLVAAQVGVGGADDLGLPALTLGVPQVHPHQVAGEQRGLLTALSRLDLQDDVFVVVGVAGDEQGAEPLNQFFALGGKLLRLVSEARVLGGQLLGGLDVAFDPVQFPVGGDDGGELGVALGQGACLSLVGVHCWVGELLLQLVVLAE